MKLKIDEIFENKNKGKVCEEILRSLPLWFGIEGAIQNYVRDVETMPTFVANIQNEQTAFLSLKKHSPYTAEIFVMAVLEKYHRQGIGAALISFAEEKLKSQGYEFLSVKTLSPSRPNKEYDQTRKFYESMKFRAVEEFDSLWGKENPCLLLIKSLF